MEPSDSTSSSECNSIQSIENIRDALMQMSHVTKSGGRMLIGNVLRSWADISKINYLEDLSWKSRRSSIKLRSFAIACKELHTMPSLLPNGILKKTEEIIKEEFPHNVTSLMNEDRLWGCFYNFPELYDDMYSPVVHVLELRDVADLVDGVLTRDMVAACLTYLHRTPILGDYVYIKLNLQGKRLRNIDVLQHYKYLVYLDLSSNLLKDIKVLSHLLYLQYLSVDFNRLETVLEYSTHQVVCRRAQTPIPRVIPRGADNSAQWFLTEVHYKYNSVKNIRDLDMFWSITILDLSRNNIKSISGLESLKYLRHLDLSFNHIQRLENLNHLRLLWLDVSYNNISSFELGTDAGLWTLLHLDYLNLNENNLKSMKMFSGCTRLRELHLRNNGMSSLLELAVYMRQMRRLIVLDMRANPICSAPGYDQVVFDTFPLLLNLDAMEIDPVSQTHILNNGMSSLLELAVDMRQMRRLIILDLRATLVCSAPGYDQVLLDTFPLLLNMDAMGIDPVSQRSSKMDTLPDVNTFASRRLLRLLYVEQLSRARISVTPPADTREVPLVVLVGKEAVGKGTLAAKLAAECSSKIKHGRQHTTATFQSPDNYILVSQQKFDDMILAGEFLTYSEIDGESYGLSRGEAFISDGKVCVCSMDLIGALMLKMRGRRPYLILTYCHDQIALAARQLQRKEARIREYEKLMSLCPQRQQSTLAVLLSGRIIINGILNEIIMTLPDEKGLSEFALGSECSLLKSDAHRASKNYAKGVEVLSLLSISSEDSLKSRKTSEENTSMQSLYKQSQDSSVAVTASLGSCDEKKNKNKETNQKKTGGTELAHGSALRFEDKNQERRSSMWRGYMSTKSSKSVTFTTPTDVAGLTVQPLTDEQKQERKTVELSISAKLPPHKKAYTSPDDLDLWLAFLTETGVIRASDTGRESTTIRTENRPDDPNSIIRQLNYYNKTPAATVTSNLRDDYEDIHRLCPGLFRDTIAMDDTKKAFIKAKHIIRDIVNSQNGLNSMFDIEFTNNLSYYPTVEQRLEEIRKVIAPRQIFC